VITFKQLVFVLAGFVVLFPAAVLAHGGGLNKEGCHNNRKTGDYHCHRGPKAAAKQQRSPKQQTLELTAKVGDVGLGGVSWLLSKHP